MVAVISFAIAVVAGRSLKLGGWLVVATLIVASWVAASMVSSNADFGQLVLALLAYNGGLVAQVFADVAWRDLPSA